MERNYYGDKKRELIEKKIKKQDKFKLVITDWIDNILTKIEEFFDNLEIAKKVGERKKGSVKIYDRDNQLIHSQKNNVSYTDDDFYA